MPINSYLFSSFVCWLLLAKTSSICRIKRATSPNYKSDWAANYCLLALPEYPTTVGIATLVKLQTIKAAGNSSFMPPKIPPAKPPALVAKPARPVEMMKRITANTIHCRPPHSCKSFSNFQCKLASQQCCKAAHRQELVQSRMEKQIHAIAHDGRTAKHCSLPYQL